MSSAYMSGTVQRMWPETKQGLETHKQQTTSTPRGDNVRRESQGRPSDKETSDQEFERGKQ